MAKIFSNLIKTINPQIKKFPTNSKHKKHNDNYKVYNKSNQIVWKQW